MKSVDGLPAFTVKVTLSDPPAEMQQRVEGRKQRDIDEFNHFRSEQSVYYEENKLNYNGFSELPFEPVFFEPRSYLLVNAEIIDGPPNYNSFFFKYPTTLTGLDFSQDKYAIPDLGLVPNIGSPHLRAIEYATEAVGDMMIQRTILKYVVIVQVFHNGQVIAQDKIIHDP